MMLSPETYYEMNLKGKPHKEILKEIRSLKRTINRSIKHLEYYFEIEYEKWIRAKAESDKNEYQPEPPEMILARLKLNQEYLEHAIQAYQEAGGQYIPTKMEQRSQDFDAALDSIRELTLEELGTIGITRRTYTVSGEVVTTFTSTFRLFETRDKSRNYFLTTNEYISCNDLFTKDEFIAGLKKIHIGAWKKNYYRRSIDGGSWDLEIYFNNGRKPLKIHGINARPYNYFDLTEFLEYGMETY